MTASVPALAMADWLESHGAHMWAVSLRAAAHMIHDGVVYMVTTGEYSYYRVVGVFGSRENADRFMATQIDSNGESLGFNPIEEYKLDYPLPQIESGLKPFRVLINLDGNGARAGAVELDQQFEESKLLELFPNQIDYPNLLQGNVWARDETHAIKIANEKRVLFILSGAKL